MKLEVVGTDPWRSRYNQEMDAGTKMDLTFYDLRPFAPLISPGWNSRDSGRAKTMRLWKVTTGSKVRMEERL